MTDREREIQARIEAYTSASGVKKMCLLDGATIGIKARAVEDISFLLSETARLRAALEGGQHGPDQA